MVPTLSPSSPRHPCRPHIIPVSSSSSPHCPIAPRRSPCGPHGCGLHGLLLSPWSPPHVVPTPCCPHHLHIVPVIPTLSLSFPHHPHSPQKVPMWSPWLWSPWSPLLSPWSPPHVVPMVPVVPTSSPSSPCRPRHFHIVYKVPTSSLSPQISTPPTPHPLGGGGSRISKNAIRF